MHNKEEKNTSTMPLLGWKTEDKIYIHPESGDEINMGPFFEFFYHNETREVMDLEVQKVIMFVDTLVGELLYHDNSVLLTDYHSVNYFLKCLKDCLWLMRKEDPTAFRQMNRKGQVKDLQSRVKIMDEGYSYSRDKKKIRQLVNLLLDPLLEKFKN